MKNVTMFSKIGIALLLASPFALFAETNAVMPVTTSVDGGQAVSYNGACASSAVVTHEDTLQSIRETNQNAMKVVSITRREALKAAYLLTEESARNAAIKSAMNASMVAEKIASKTMQDSLMKENNSFMIIMRGCGVTSNPMFNPMEANMGMMNNMMNKEDNGQKEEGGRMMNPSLMKMSDVDTGWLQKVLMSAGVFSGKADGKFGPMTKNALKEFQGKHKLKADGVLGPKTFELLKSEGGDNGGTESE